MFGGRDDAATKLRSAAVIRSAALARAVSLAHAGAGQLRAFRDLSAAKAKEKKMKEDEMRKLQRKDEAAKLLAKETETKAAQMAAEEERRGGKSVSAMMNLLDKSNVS
jgi:hypothetical protein